MQASLAEEAKARQREFDEQLYALNARVAALEDKVPFALSDCT